jgi:membrane protease subunit (stomatin/prohibitin family)
MSNSASTDDEVISGIKQVLSVSVVVALLAGIYAAATNPSEPVSAFITVTIGIGIFMCILSAAVVYKEYGPNQQSKKHQQQQQIGSDSGPTRICPECGWKNAKSNNYCNDCGFSFDSGEGDE